MDHKGKQPTFVYLCALLFEKEPANLFSPGNNLTEGHDGPRRQAANLRVPPRPSVRKKNPPLYSGDDQERRHQPKSSGRLD